MFPRHISSLFSIDTVKFLNIDDHDQLVYSQCIVGLAQRFEILLNSLAALLKFNAMKLIIQNMIVSIQ